MKNLLITALILLFAGATEITAQSYQIIVNNDNPVETISKKELSNIFLKKKTSWNDGSSITPVDLDTRSTTRAAFTLEIHEQSIGSIRSYWQQAAFSGSATAPLERKSDADIIAFVQSYPGAIGYVSNTADISGVKVLTVN